MDYSFAHLDELFDYHPDTGVVTYKVVRGRNRIGSKAGSIYQFGYVVIRVGTNGYLAHRVGWILTHGSIPNGMHIDHINGIEHDNRLNNLRLVTVSHNHRNTKLYKTNTSGAMGVYQTPERKWKAIIGVQGKKIHLGHYSTKEEAIAARKKAENLHGFHPNHGRVIQLEAA